MSVRAQVDFAAASTAAAVARRVMEEIVNRLRQATGLLPEQRNCAGAGKAMCIQYKHDKRNWIPVAHS
jgi:hypothetical protein